MRVIDVWHDGRKLTPAEYTVIYANHYGGGSYRFMYNRLKKTFVPVFLVKSSMYEKLSDVEYLCFRSDLDEAKKIAYNEGLDVDSVEYRKIG